MKYRSQLNTVSSHLQKVLFHLNRCCDTVARRSDQNQKELAEDIAKAAIEDFVFDMGQYLIIQKVCLKPAKKEKE